jgi:putative ABC transport system permease protein
MRDSFRVNYAMEAVAILVALLGLAQSLLASAVDRRREFGVLRALGATRRDICRSLTLEGGLLGLCGGILGIIGGTLISFHHVVYNTKALTGWSLEYHFSWAWCQGIVFGSVFLSALAGLCVGQHVARQRITDAIQYE